MIRKRKYVQLERAPALWWKRSTPQPAACYGTKTAALNVFLDANRDVVDRYGGETAIHTPAEFDSINHKYGLKGKNRVATMADALWQVLRGGPPWCLEDIDLQTLNETSPAVNYRNFMLPDIAEETKWLRQEARYHEEEAVKSGRRSDCFTAKTQTKRYGLKEFRNCVCRNKRGQFKSCTIDDVPF